MVELFQLGAEEADHVVARDERRRFGRLRLQDAPTQFRGGRNACRAALTHAFDHAKPRQRIAGRARARAPS